jgi:1,4-alpha-glucan branching enzyme
VPTSSDVGMGAISYPGGVGFRVWAPFAQSVAVAGEFNNWSASGNPLSSEGNGYWSADVDGATVGQEYKYVVVHDGQTLCKNDPYAREIDTTHNNSVVYDPTFDWQDESFTMPPWNELVIYELHVGTFNDPATSTPGRFQGVIDKLDYLRDLGVNAIEVMAAGEFDMDFSWGYNPAYIYAIASSYGGVPAFKEFVRSAHQRGIAVIFDVVYNHLGYPAQDMWRFDGWYQGDDGGIYFYNDWRCDTPWGCTRLDYGRPEVRQYIQDNALMWQQDCRVDGLRWDAVGYIRNVYGHNNDPSNDLPDGWGLLQWVNDELNAQQPWKISIAEDMQDNSWITRIGAGGAGFDAQWDAPFVHTIRAAVIAARDEDRDMAAVADSLRRRYNVSAFERVVYTESHDEDANGQSRVPEEIWPGNAGSWFSKKRSTLGAALVFTSPAIPMIFQGQEFLENGWFSDKNRLDWTKTQTYAGIVSLYRDLMRLRRNWFDNTRGLRGQSVNVFHVNNTDKVVAFHRWDQGGPRDDVLVVANFGNRDYASYNLGFPRAGLWRVRFNSDWNGYSPDFGNHLSYDTTANDGPRDGLAYQGNVGIGAYSAIILSQDS